MSECFLCVHARACACVCVWFSELMLLLFRSVCMCAVCRDGSLDDEFRTRLKNVSHIIDPKWRETTGLSFGVRIIYF